MSEQHSSCYQPQCPKRHTCTLWMNALEDDRRGQVFLSIVNPAIIEAAGGYEHCPLYYEWRKRRFARGLVWKYPELTGAQWAAIRHDLAMEFYPSTLRRIRFGYEAISPEEQSKIAEIFARYAPDVEPRYKSFEEHYIKPPRIEGKEARKFLGGN